MIEEFEKEYEKRYKQYSSKPIQKVVYKYIIRNKSGCILGITGRPNFGKSWLGNKIIKDWNPKMNIDNYLVYDVPDIFENTFSNIKINGKVMTNQEFSEIGDVPKWCKENIEIIEPLMGRCLLVDEAGTSVYNRDFFSPENKAMSKLVQVWRFMRMLIIFVVPERVEFLEKTLREFFDIKIIMTGMNNKERYAKAMVFERRGRNYKDEPIFMRIPGCKNRGIINIAPLDYNYPETAKEYEKRSRIYKTSIIMQARRDVMESSGQYVKKSRHTVIDEYMEKARGMKDNLMNENKKSHLMKYDEFLIQNQLNVSIILARRIRAQLEMEERIKGEK